MIANSLLCKAYQIKFDDARIVEMWKILSWAQKIDENRN
jgi:hypothetical protein